MSELIPEYLSIDFSTIVAKIKEELAASDNQVFRDLNYEGSNISLLIELVAYIGELNVYYLNKLAKNIYMETADIYEAVNRKARFVGYEPKGYRSGKLTLTAVVANCPTTGIKVPAWKEIDSGELNDDGEAIKYITTAVVTESTPTSAFTFSIPVRQGELVTLPVYTGSDLVDNELILPSDYAYDDDLDDDYPTIEVNVKTDYITYDKWTRVDDFYDEATLLNDDDDLYTFVYDKYKRSKVVFHSSRNVPASDVDILIKVIKCLGSTGSVGASVAGWSPEEEFIYDTTGLKYLNNSTITISNSGASIGASEPETVDEIKENAKSALHAQFRNVTSTDYISNLESRSDIIAANAWGEQDIAPSGSVPEYNKVYISVIPSSWGTGSISTSASIFITDWGTSESIDIPVSFSSVWADTLKDYMEPRKMLSAYEVFQEPELIYFSFDIGVRIKRLYSLADVSEAILNKMIYYFRNANMDFNSTINFMDILSFVTDTSLISPTDSFTNIKGISNFIIREINTSVSVYDYNIASNYPYYTEDAYTGDNLLRPIKLGHNQFPVLSSGTIRFTEEV